MTDLSIADLRKLANVLLDHLESQGMKHVRLDDDFYWDVPAAERYDQYAEPQKHSVGQLSDDISELRRILDGVASPIGYALVWYAAVLRRLGEKASG